VLSRKRFLRFLIGQAPLLLAVTCLGLLMGFLLDRLDRNRIEAFVSSEIDALAADLRQQVQTRLHSKQLALGGLVVTAEILPDMTREEFGKIAQRVIDDHPAIMSLTIAPDLIVSYSFPAAGNAMLIGQDLRAMPAQFPDVDTAISRDTAIISRPFIATQGKRAIAIRERIDAPDGRLWGLASLAIDLDAFFAPIIAAAQAERGYHITITAPGVGLFGDPALAARQPRSVNVSAEGFRFTLSVVPQEGWPVLPLFTPTRVGIGLAMILLLWSGHANYQRNYQRRVVVERLEKGIDALSSGFVIFDDQDRLVHWNETYEKLFSKGSVLRKGMTFADLIRLDMKHGIYRVPTGQEEAWFNQLMSGHSAGEESAEVQLADGRWIRMLSRRTQEGDLVGVRFDITDLKRAQLTAERASSAKSEFISVLSHELRTPLTVILGFGRLLQARPLHSGDPVQDGFMRDATARIVQSGDHLLKLVNEMLDYVNLTSAMPCQKVEAFDLCAVIARITADFATQARAKGVQLEAEACHATVAADPVRVAQIIENLLSNAVKFTSAGGSVRISTREGPEFVKITISDTGDGIPKEKLDAIFEEFSQIHPSGTRRQGGTGLGLAITKRLVALQGGDISVQSTPGVGSSFTFSLPRERHAA
jgi:two-component system, cell cycle sensor histidine kinase PleC